MHHNTCFPPCHQPSSLRPPPPTKNGEILKITRSSAPLTAAGRWTTIVQQKECETLFAFLLLPWLGWSKILGPNFKTTFSSFFSCVCVRPENFKCRPKMTMMMMQGSEACMSRGNAFYGREGGGGKLMQIAKE